MLRPNRPAGPDVPTEVALTAMEHGAQLKKATVELNDLTAGQAGSAQPPDVMARATREISIHTQRGLAALLLAAEPRPAAA